MRSKTEAIIISSLNLGEADKLVTFFSLERGMLKGVARNARKSFKRFGAGLESFTRVRLHLHEREHQELCRIDSADILAQHSGISAELDRSAAGAVMLELTRELAPLGERNAPAFRMLSQTLSLLAQGHDPQALLGIFEIKLLSLLGYQPRLDICLVCGAPPKGDALFDGMKGGIVCTRCTISDGTVQARLSAGASGYYYQALRMDMDKVARLKPSPAIVRELDRVLGEHTMHILGKRLKSTQFCKALLALDADTREGRPF
jgi:DNA repair protein RecO (recombination protein O)